MTSLSWIGALWSFLCNSTGPLYAWINCKIDDRYTILIAGVLSSLAMMLASITHNIWGLYLSQGALAGLTASLIYYPCINQVLVMFSDRRAMALGISMAGIGIGSLVFSNIATACFTTVGYRWSLRIIGWIQLVLCAIAALSCVKLKGYFSKHGVSFWNLDVFRSKRFCILLGAHFIAPFAFYIPSAFIAPYAESIGMDAWSIANINGIVGVFKSVGSIILGYLADRLVGRLNMGVLAGCLGVISFLAIWLIATTPATVWVFAALYGIAEGTLVDMMITTIVDCVGLNKTNAGTGWALFLWCFGGLLGQPLASVIVNKDETPDYSSAIIFAAMLYVVTTLIMIALRVLFGSWKVLKKV
ncbi:MFS general substrate transporter [Lichtheimia hyalospora FSU 10163]|nr:MFS general substrate transporter [Lichtheimia hyalospora FSU 10163]